MLASGWLIRLNYLSFGVAFQVLNGNLLTFLQAFVLSLPIILFLSLVAQNKLAGIMLFFNTFLSVLLVRSQWLVAIFSTKNIGFILFLDFLGKLVIFSRRAILILVIEVDWLNYCLSMYLIVRWFAAHKSSN
jgi:hypothetical protein